MAFPAVGNHVKNKLFAPSLNKCFFEPCHQVVEQRFLPSQEMSVKHGDLEEEIFFCFIKADPGCPHAMANLKARIPERVENSLCNVRQLLFRTIVMKKHEVNVLKMEQLPATVPTQGYQGHIGRAVAELLKGARQSFVH